VRKGCADMASVRIVGESDDQTLPNVSAGASGEGLYEPVPCHDCFGKQSGRAGKEMAEEAELTSELGHSARGCGPWLFSFLDPSFGR
jgi:hypothetical protein